MARGWESKSVESQQTENVTRSPKAQLTREQLERQRKRESLELSRARVSRDLETASTEVHRAALRNALAFLEEELSRLEAPQTR
jgi:hypothetical protein